MQRHHKRRNKPLPSHPRLNKTNNPYPSPGSKSGSEPRSEANPMWLLLSLSEARARSDAVVLVQPCIGA